MFKLKAAKGCSIRTSNPQNSTSQSRQGTADLTACEQISPSFKITKPKIPATNLCKGFKFVAQICYIHTLILRPEAIRKFYTSTQALTTRIKLKSTRNAHPKAQGNRRSNMLTAPAIHVRAGSSGSLKSLFLAFVITKTVNFILTCSPKSSRKPKIKSAHCTSNSRTRRVFGISQIIVPSFQTSINGKIKSQGVQRHQEHQKQMLESTGNGDRK
ncbi:tripeptidyl-peptidase 2-like [Dorcoceras hygrometricum]|uniref:Tripeptidyl-peptidase 2-like n=1 Tax=Dorcoceras hygrometricum TaxID=472368 RepID=A0A2Z7AWV1_9LAMI|nr:tripeptidyl-peptidase 2-like [Dorcoceras hygrometricum]